MIIFITQKCIRDEHGIDLDALEAAYVTYFTRSNVFDSPLVLLPVPNNIVHIERLVAKVRPGLVMLTGGNNIDPQSFGSNAHVDDLAPRRDEVEKYLLSYALAESIPIIGICRGFHFINVYLGGTITLQLSDHPPGVVHYCEYDGKNYQVNSYHNHGITQVDVADALEPIAKATDGRLIEAYTASDKGEMRGKRILGVQWHPERPGVDEHIFKQLVDKYINLKKGS